MATIFKRKGGSPWIIQYFDAAGRRREKSTRTSDYRAAERIANKLEADVALRREGVIDARQDRYAEAGRIPLTQHVADYLQHCRGKGLAAHTVKDKKRHLDWLMGETRATRLSDLTLDTVERALATFHALGRTSRTVNTRRETFRAFGNWCRKTSRLGSHPLELLPKLDEHRDRKRIRRPLSDEELARLLEVAESRGRRGWYLTAALSGLRRSELIRLTWESVDFELGVLTIRDGKAKRVDVVPLHPELLEELKRIRPADASPLTRVFPTEVTNLTRKKDFERAGIKLRDAQGRVADFHGLRATLGTRLARAGVAPQVAQRLMRHADYRTTLHHYTMLSLADTVAAMTRLPGGGATLPTSAKETDSPAEDPQQIPQHSAHDEAPASATSCCDSASGVNQEGERKPCSEQVLREELPGNATPCDEDDLVLSGAESGLGNRRSIQLSYGRIPSTLRGVVRPRCEGPRGYPWRASMALARLGARVASVRIVRASTRGRRHARAAHRGCAFAKSDSQCGSRPPANPRARSASARRRLVAASADRRAPLPRLRVATRAPAATDSRPSPA